MSDTLLEIIARLQQPGAFSPAQGRQALLDYARKRAKSRLGLLFRLDATEQNLLLVEQSGAAPRRASRATAVPLDGLFATALQSHELLFINESDAATRILPAERAWLGRDSHILLCATGISANSDEAHAHLMPQGVLILSTGPHPSPTTLSKQAQQDILLSSALLGTYLTTPPDGGAGESQNVGMPLVGIRDGIHGAATHNDDAIRNDTAIPTSASAGDDVTIHSSAANILHPLAALYEIGLADGNRMYGSDDTGVADEQAIYRLVLNRLKDMLDAAGGGLWLYAPTQGQFVLRASTGEDSDFIELIEDELAQAAAMLRSGRFARHEHGRRHSTRVVTWSPERIVVLHLLEYGVNDVVGVARPVELIGATALVIKGKQDQDISASQRLMLVSGSRAAAAVIRGWQRHLAERQAIIEAERSRLARDIHDGAAQQMAQAITALEYAGHIIERQPDAARQEIEQARIILIESLNSLRQSIVSLLPAPLGKASLDGALDALLDDFRRGNPAIEIHYEAAWSKNWPPSQEIALYRLVQEALQNIRKHAHASRVMIKLQALPGMIVAQVSDNGAGFDSLLARRNDAGQPPQFGLRSMREQVEQAGGTFTLTSKPGEGTTVKATFPLPTHATALTSRERDVLRLLVAGASNRVMAEQLSVSIETVKSHMHHIMQKLGVKDRTQAAVLATRQQWV